MIRLLRCATLSATLLLTPQQSSATTISSVEHAVVSVSYTGDVFGVYQSALLLEHVTSLITTSVRTPPQKRQPKLDAKTAEKQKAVDEAMMKISKYGVQSSTEIFDTHFLVKLGKTLLDFKELGNATVITLQPKDQTSNGKDMVRLATSLLVKGRALVNREKDAIATGNAIVKEAQAGLNAKAPVINAPLKRVLMVGDGFLDGGKTQEGKVVIDYVVKQSQLIRDQKFETNPKTKQPDPTKPLNRKAEEQKLIEAMVEELEAYQKAVYERYNWKLPPVAKPKDKP